MSKNESWLGVEMVTGQTIGELRNEVDRLKAENIRLQAEVEYQIDYTKKRGSQMLLDLAEINRLKAEIERIKAKEDHS